ncbi:MAG TPA: pilus assembly protein PilM [Tepidisphaeraceae bacterium]|nr:pilus assembly protein PilM [Tepidisphaeraceae bacterium]
MFNLPGSRQTPIGLDVGGRHFAAVQLTRGKCATRVAAALLLPRTDDSPAPSGDEAHRLVQAMDRAGFIGRRAVVAVPREKLLGSLVELPRGAALPVEQMARMEVARSHRCTPDSFEVACWELPAPARPTRVSPVMAVACRHEDAAAILDPLESAGLDVIALDARACALARAAARLTPASRGVTALLDLGWSAATLVLLYQGAVVYERKIPDAGIGKLHAVLCERLHLEREVADYLLGEASDGGPAAASAGSQDARTLLSAHLEALSGEASASFAYAAHQYADAGVERVLLSGYGAAIPDAARRLSKLFGVESRTLAPADLAPCRPEQKEACMSPALLSAMGLAMHGTCELSHAMETRATESCKA